VCAVRRVVVSPAQPGGTQGTFLGQRLTGGRKAEGTGACREGRAAGGR